MADCAGMVSAVPGYTLRRLERTDAEGVSTLVREVYGESYYPPDLYDPERIVQLNAAGRLASMVALEQAGQVVGHYALLRSAAAAIAEASDAIVSPGHRHHHLMEELRRLLRAEADRLGLTGLVGYPVTNHLYSQKAEEHFGASCCGVALGLWPRSFHNMPDPLPQRMSFFIYFQYLRAPLRVVHAATHHAEMLGKICRQFGISVETAAGPADGALDRPGALATEYEAPVQAGTIRVRQLGRDTAAAIAQAQEELCAGKGARAVTLELPLAQPGIAEVCRAAEAIGFFFSGLGPAFAADGNALLLQFVADDLDPSLLEIDAPFARELLTYAAGERERVHTKRVVS